jgi:hypothetical protein
MFADSSHPKSRRARPAIDEVFDGGPVPTRMDLEASVSREHTGSRGALHAAWEQLASEIDRANRPRGRATPVVREVVRRIVRLMAADGATREEIREALVRAVMRQHRTLHDVVSTLEIAVSESLLADVLHCAADEGRRVGGRLGSGEG